MHKQTPKQAAYLFFLKHAGFSYDPKTETARAGRSRCARELAKAERDARALGYVFEWDNDSDGIDGNEDYIVETCESCVCLSNEVDADGDRDRHILASLGAITNATPEYRRVIEAELASEALAAR
jgi:hypothetical protein